jgi:hypothetical protein
LKAAVAGTNLTFTLYTDARCTQQAFHQVVPVETVAFVLSAQDLHSEDRAEGAEDRRGPPPTAQEHAVTVQLHHHVYELAQWAYRYEQANPVLGQEGRTFEAFLADCIEGDLVRSVTRWRHAAG